MKEPIPNPILPIGRISWADAEGFLPNIAVTEIAAPWRTAVDAACGAAEAALGGGLVSILCRGSLARGTAVEGISDLDLVLVVARSPTMAERIALQTSGRAIAAAFPGVSDVEFLVLEEEDLLSSRRRAWMRFILAHQGLALRGCDLSRRLPPARLDADAVAHDRPGARWYVEWLDHWRAAPDDAGRKAACAWLMKRLVRASFERIMFDLGGYARDLHPAVTAVIQRHPERAEDLWTACRLAIDPVADLRTVAAAALSTGGRLGYGDGAPWNGSPGSA